MTLLDVADRRQALIERLGLTTASIVLALWRQRMRQSVNLDDLIEQWLILEPLIERQVAISQQAAANGADDYLDAVAVEQDEPAGAPWAMVPSSVAGIGSNGFPLRDMLDNAVVTIGSNLLLGAPKSRAFQAGQVDLIMHAETQIADAGRAAEQVSMATRDWPAGYVRMIEPGACARCIVLAGKFYRRNAGFDRHPRCRCVHVPKAEDSADDVRTDPKAYFDALERGEIVDPDGRVVRTDQVFGKAGAEAIRQGADISQVVNARLGITTATVGGREVLTTTQGTTRRGYMAAVRKELARARGEVRVRKQPRLMPEEIMRLSGDDRMLSRRLLINNGYIVGDIAALAREAAK